MLNENLHVTRDFEEWKSAILIKQAEIEPDKLIFPEEIKDSVTGYMLQAVGSANGAMLMVAEKNSDTLQQAVEYLRNMNDQFDVYLHQMTWRHITVDGYTINSIIVKFSTTDKQNA